MLPLVPQPCACHRWRISSPSHGLMLCCTQSMPPAKVPIASCAMHTTGWCMAVWIWRAKISKKCSRSRRTPHRGWQSWAILPCRKAMPHKRSACWSFCASAIRVRKPPAIWKHWCACTGPSKKSWRACACWPVLGGRKRQQRLLGPCFRMALPRPACWAASTTASWPVPRAMQRKRHKRAKPLTPCMPARVTPTIAWSRWRWSRPGAHQPPRWLWR